VIAKLLQRGWRMFPIVLDLWEEAEVKFPAVSLQQHSVATRLATVRRMCTKSAKPWQTQTPRSWSSVGLCSSATRRELCHCGDKRRGKMKKSLLYGTIMWCYCTDRMIGLLFTTLILSCLFQHISTNMWQKPFGRMLFWILSTTDFFGSFLLNHFFRTSHPIGDIWEKRMEVGWSLLQTTLQFQHQFPLTILMSLSAWNPENQERSWASQSLSKSFISIHESWLWLDTIAHFTMIKASIIGKEWLLTQHFINISDGYRVGNGLFRNVPIW